MLKEEKRQRKSATTTSSTITTSSSTTTSSSITISSSITTSSSSKTCKSKTDLDAYINENLIELHSDTNTSPPSTINKLSEDDDETYASQDIA